MHIREKDSKSIFFIIHIEQTTVNNFEYFVDPAALSYANAIEGSFNRIN